MSLLLAVVPIGCGAKKAPSKEAHEPYRVQVTAAQTGEPAKITLDRQKVASLAQLEQLLADAPDKQQRRIELLIDPNASHATTARAVLSCCGSEANGKWNRHAAVVEIGVDKEWKELATDSDSTVDVDVGFDSAGILLSANINENQFGDDVNTLGGYVAAIRGSDSLENRDELVMHVKVAGQPTRKALEELVGAVVGYNDPKSTQIVALTPLRIEFINAVK